MGEKSFPLLNKVNLLGFVKMKLLLTLITPILCLAIINITPDYRVFSKFGKETLFFYIYHVFLIQISNYLFGYFDIKPNLTILLSLSVFIIISLAYMNKIILLRKLLNPYSEFIKRTN